MATPAGAPFNAEPSLTEDPKQHLPPKSYADAVEEEPPVNGSNGADRSNGTNGATHATGANGTSSEEVDQSKPNQHIASVLRIVDTGSDAKEKGEERPKVERQESKHEYSATVCAFTTLPSSAITNPLQGVDDTPQTPTRQKHRKSSSKSNNESEAKTTTNGNAPNTNGNNQAIDSKAQADSENTTAFEKVEGEQNGSKLTSVKPAGSYEKEHRTDYREKRKPKKQDGLASGRKAGQRWETSAIRWAPMNVPLQRRLQTLVVLFHTLCIALSVSAFFFLCAIPLFWPLLIPYMIYCMSSKASTSGTLSHRSDFLRSSPIWSLFASYFPARLHRTQELPPTRKYIFGYHPHGIISHGAFAAFGTEALGFSQLFPGIKNTLLTLDSNFRIPIYRDYALAMGLASVSKVSCENLLSKGGRNNVCMILLNSSLNC
jgi:2-acylglycerol O-acyltransferase 2